MTAADVASRLGARAAGDGRWAVRCPAHADRTPSLAIRAGDGGRVLLRCWAGCATTDVLAAAGISWADIMGGPTAPEDRARQRREREQRQAAETAQRQRERHRQSLLGRADAALAALARAAMADGPAGDAAAARYHRLLAARRAAEGCDAAA